MTRQKMKPFSVLLLYPDYMSDEYGKETYYGHVKALNADDAVDQARIECMAVNPDTIDDPDDLFCHLVIEGHHNGLESKS